MTNPTIRFANKNAALFVDDVKARVAAYFEQEGRSRSANGQMKLKTVILLGGSVGAYAAILSGAFGPWGMLALSVLLGVGMAGIGFSVAHDALHGAYSGSARVNRWLGYTFDLVGANGYMWRITHNVIHHTYTNIPGVDEDLTVSPLLRLSPGAERTALHRWQHVYCWFAYSLSTLNWVFVKDYQQFLKRDIGPYKDKRHSAREWAVLVVAKLFAYVWMIVLPLVLLPITWWQFALGFLAMHLTAGIILGVIFQLAHVVEGIAYPEPDASGQMEHAWLVHELYTTSNFAPGNTLLSWYIGGLNYQIEHHLFPQVCSVHYPALSRLVRAAAEAHGIPYHSQPTLLSAMGSHFAMLKRLGRAPTPVPVGPVIEGALS
jgi:linoleoyl-CoA desaturase